MANYIYNNGSSDIIKLDTTTDNSSTLLGRATLNNDGVFVITESGTLVHKWQEKNEKDEYVDMSKNITVNAGDIVFVNYSIERDTDKRTIIVVNSESLYNDYIQYLEYKQKIKDDVTNGKVIIEEGEE